MELTLEEGLELRENKVIVITAQHRSTTLLCVGESRLVLGGELLMGLSTENAEGKSLIPLLPKLTSVNISVHHDGTYIILHPTF